VFAALAAPEQPRDGTAIRSAVEAGDVAAVGRLLFNRLQGPAEALCPPVKTIYDRLAAHQPAGCLMSGSGSTLFALCDGRADAARLAEALREELPGDPPPRVFVVRTTVPE
jgi:4-diphosphocytidyl-2-C-methyl-D-erythritol kinase